MGRARRNDPGPVRAADLGELGDDKLLNQAVASQLQNPLTRGRDQQDHARILKLFAELPIESDQHALILRRYLDGRPEKFFAEQAYDTYLHWLQHQDNVRPEQLKGYFSDHESEIDHALLFLREINLEDWHDNPLTDSDDYELMRVIDKQVHPAYLRLVEGVFTPLIRPLAYFSRLDRNKSTVGLDTWSITEELRGHTGQYFTKYYTHILRNGIAHGGISFLDHNIRYRDNKGNEEIFTVASVIQQFDDLLDVCNGVVAAFKVFFLLARSQGYIPPRGLMIEALQEQTWAPWWTIEGCVEAEIAGRAQLILYARPNTRDYNKVLWSTVQSGILSESLAPGYDRYFFSLRSRKALPGWAAFDGVKLRELREQEARSLTEYRGILEDNLIFYVPKPGLPSILKNIDTLTRSARIAIPFAFQEVRAKLGIPSVLCRQAALHRNSWGAVLRGSVVIEDVDSQDMAEIIRRNCGYIIKRTRAYARREGRYGFAEVMPIGFAQISVFRRDYRQRKLSNFGLGDDLVCTVRLHRIRRIKSPDILGSTIERVGKYRIAWNRAWLNAVGHKY